MRRQRDMPPPRRDKTPVLIRQILGDLPDGDVTLGDLVLRFRRRSFGGIFVLLTLCSLLPIISFFAGLIIIIPALQMAGRLQAPILPGFIKEREIRVSSIRSLAARCLPGIEHAERFIRPRWLFMTLTPMPTLIGVVIVCLACVLVLPLPLINVPPAIALIFLSLGILERDGVMILIGLITAAFAIYLGVLLTGLAMEGVRLVLRAHFG